MKIGVLSNTNMSILMKNLKKSFEIYKGCGYANYIEELIQLDSGLNNFHVDVLFILLDAEELIEKYKDISFAWNELELAVQQFHETNPHVEIYVSNLDIQETIQPYFSLLHNENLITEWNSFLETGTHSGIKEFDLVGLIRTIGQNQFYSESLWYLASTKYSNDGLKEIENSICRIVRAGIEPRKKCLILDLDNTIWGGILGEDGYENIKISNDGEGRIYYDFQKEIKGLKNTGILICIASKNNKEEVEQVFKKNKNLILKIEDFALIKANWRQKTENIKEIAEELNIGLDSIVFIDDNPMEQELVKINLPEVIVPKFPENIYGIKRFIKKIYDDYFFTISLTEEDKEKTNQYFLNEKRRESQSLFESYEEYLECLDIQIDFYPVKEDEFVRASQLTQKTNQFNLTTKRYTMHEIRDLEKTENMNVYIGSVEDRFGDYGKVILVIFHVAENKMFIDTFLMSCRVMGKQIEKRILNMLEQLAKEMKLNVVVGYYIKTSKNEPVERFYIENGFILKKGSTEGLEYIKEMS